MSKYIIRNCPANYSVLGKDCLCGDTECKDCTDCLLKRIVGLCKEQKVINCNIDGKEQVLKVYYHTHLSNKILELLEIEECGDE